MRRREDYAFEKVTIRIRKGDSDRLRELHGRLGAAKVIRELIIGHIKRVDENVAQKITTKMEDIL